MAEDIMINAVMPDSDVGVLNKAINSVQIILDSLASSDFAIEHGAAAVRGLREYSCDMVIDIAERFTGTKLTDNDKRYILNKFPEANQALPR